MDSGCADDIYALPVGNRYLVYSPLQYISALVNKAAVHELSLSLTGKGSKHTLPPSLSDLAATLAPPLTNLSGLRTGPLRPLFLGIIPTRACNMSCGYCDFDSQKAADHAMDFSIAVAAVDWMAAFLKDSGNSTLEVHFFGGEPFVAGDVVDVVIHRARSLAAVYGLETHFEVSTNGLCDRQRAKFMGDYFDAVVLSLDGFKTSHDAHRPINRQKGSFEAVVQTAAHLSRSPTDLCIRCCISQINVNQMAEIAEWLCRDFQPKVINFEVVCENPQSHQAGLFPPDPYVFAKEYMRAYRRILQFGITASYASAEPTEIRNSFCPVGKDALIVSPDRRISSCYLPPAAWLARGLDMDVGRLDPMNGMDIDMAAIERLRRLVTDKPRCEACFCKWTCGGGCHVSNSYPGCGLKYNDFCLQTRLITACLLMEELGQGELANHLLHSPPSMQQLALQSNDRIAVLAKTTNNL
jgi:uncharacterized protein